MVNRGEEGEYFGSLGSGAQGAATKLNYTMPMHLVSNSFVCNNRKENKNKRLVENRDSRLLIGRTLAL